MDLQSTKAELIKKLIATDNEELIRRIQQVFEDFTPQQENEKDHFQSHRAVELKQRIAAAEDDIKYGRISSHEDVMKRFRDIECLA